MWSRLWRVGLACVSALLPALRLDAQNAAQDSTATHNVLNKYCAGCHNPRTKAGDLVLQNADLAAIPANSQMWEKVVKKLRSGTMPPSGAPRPDDATYNSAAAWIESKLDSAPTYAGRPALHRLNRSEYANAIRDLLHLDVISLHCCRLTIPLWIRQCFGSARCFAGASGTLPVRCR